jgi:hypothetical protein
MTAPPHEFVDPSEIRAGDRIEPPDRPGTIATVESVDASAFNDATGVTVYQMTLRNCDADEWPTLIDDRSPVRRFLRS